MSGLPYSQQLSFEVKKGSRATKFSVAAINLQNYTVITTNYATSVQNFFANIGRIFVLFSNSQTDKTQKNRTENAALESVHA